LSSDDKSTGGYASGSPNNAAQTVTSDMRLYTDQMIIRAKIWRGGPLGRPGLGYGCMITVTGGLPGNNNVPVLLLAGIKIPGAPPPVGATVACLPWLEVTVPVKP